MTPLARRIVEQLTLPMKNRTFTDRCGLLQKMSDVHCFDMTAVDEACHELATQMSKDPEKTIGRLAFLPAPRTWLEWGSGGDDKRVGLLLEEKTEKKTGEPFAAVRSAGAELFADFGSGAGFSTLPLHGSKSVGKTFGISPDLASMLQASPGVTVLGGGNRIIGMQQFSIYAALALINTPRIVGRVTHNPDKALEAAIVANSGSVGRWPLHAWHEIKLSITPPDAAAGEIEEGHLTGKRALHFVRQHLRIRLGRLELVSAHWRGDAQLGIKRARYAVTH